MRNRGRLLVGGLCLALVLAVFLRHRILTPERESGKGTPQAGWESELPVPGAGASKVGQAGGDAPAKGVPRDAELTAERVESFLKDLRKKHASARSDFQAWEHRFAIEQGLYYREARLCALAFPELTERLNTAVALDLSASPVDRGFAAWTLSIVATTDHPGGVGAVLQSLLQDSEPLVRDVSLGGLALSDKNGQLKSLYWEACRKGSLTGFTIVSQWYDPGTISEMKALLAQQPTNTDAQKVLQRMEILASSQWESEVGAMLDASKESDIASQWWALEICKIRGSKVLMEALRSRLDRGFVAAKKAWEEKGPAQGASFDQAFVRSAEISKTAQDPGFDDVLVTYSEAHGQLTDFEKARLRTFGYGCDPKQRLKELLSTGN